MTLSRGLATNSVLSEALRSAKVALLCCVTVVALLVSGCGGSAAHDDLDPDFLTAVATAEALGYSVYWLGEVFTADGLVFTGPDVADFGNEVEGGGVDMTYLAPVEGGNTGLDLIIYSRNAWELAKEKVLNPGLPGVTRRAITVGDREAELVSVPLGTRPLNTLWLLLDLGNAVVLAQAGAGGAMYTDGPDYNPFISVLDNLRPYPE